MIDLTLGQPAVSPAAGVAEALDDHLEKGSAYRYPARGGSARVRRGLVTKLRAINRVEVADGDLVVTCGASQGLLAVLASTCSPGDAMLAPSPGFPHYRLLARLLRLDLVPYPVRPDGCDLDELAAVAARAAGRAKALIWNSPHNPLGWVSNAASHTRLLDLAEALDLAVVSDEVYEALIYEGEHHSPASLGSDAAVYSVFSASKTLGIAGWRLGYVAGPPGSGADLERVVWATTMGAPTIAADAVLASLRSYPQHARTLQACLKQRRDLVLRRLKDLGFDCHVPAAGCFAWVRVPERLPRARTGPDLALAEAWRRNLRVLVTPGSAFGAGCEAFVRVSFGAIEADLEQALDRLERWQGNEQAILFTSDGR